MLEQVFYREKSGRDCCSMSLRVSRGGRACWRLRQELLEDAKHPFEPRRTLG